MFVCVHIYFHVYVYANIYIYNYTHVHVLAFYVYTTLSGYESIFYLSIHLTITRMRLSVLHWATESNSQRATKHAAYACHRQGPSSVPSFKPCGPGKTELAPMRFQQQLAAGEAVQGSYKNAVHELRAFS